MSTILRASSPALDIDTFLADCDWKVARIFRHGEKSRAGVESSSSGFNVVVSEAGFDDFAGQVVDAVGFLISQQAKVRELVGLVGSNNASLDFAVCLRDTVTQSDTFPAELVRAAGECGVALEISRYPISIDESAAE